jgi:polar amino acid transport system substrate-binding protein
LPVELVGYDTVAKLLAGLKAGEWDVAFLAVDPAAAGDVSFTAPYMEVEVTYMVPKPIEFASVSQVDRPGVRVSSRRGMRPISSSAGSSGTASLVRAANESGAFDC